MQYIRLSNNVVVEIIPEVDPAFPDVPISSRYPSAFIADLVKVTDDVEVTGGMVYDPATGTFSEYVEPSTPTTGDDSAVWDELDAAYQEGVDSV